MSKSKKIFNFFKNTIDSIFNIRSAWLIFSSLIRIIILIGLNRLMTKQLDFQNLSSYYLVISIYNFFFSFIPNFEKSPIRCGSVSKTERTSCVKST